MSKVTNLRLTQDDTEYALYYQRDDGSEHYVSLTKDNDGSVSTYDTATWLHYIANEVDDEILKGMAALRAKVLSVVSSENLPFSENNANTAE